MWPGVPFLAAAGWQVHTRLAPGAISCAGARGALPAALVLRCASLSCRDSIKEVLNLHRGMSALVGASLLLAHTRATSLARNSGDLESLAVRLLDSPR